MKTKQYGFVGVLNTAKQVHVKRTTHTVLLVGLFVCLFVWSNFSSLQVYHMPCC